MPMGSSKEVIDPAGEMGQPELLSGSTCHMVQNQDNPQPKDAERTCFTNVGFLHSLDA